MKFSEIIAPYSVEEFFNEFYEKKPLHIKRDNPNYYHELISPEELDLYLQLKGTYASNVKVAINGEEISPQKFSKQVSNISPYNADPKKLFSLFQTGHTIKYDKLHQTYPPLALKISQIEQELEFKLRTSVYITPPNSQGYGMHTDRHDVLALQINGRKFWKVANSEEVLPSHYLEPIDVNWQDAENIETLEISAGDFFYCPRGLAHDVYTKEKSSTHFTIGFKPIYRYQLFDQLSKEAYNDEFFRYSIPTKFDSKESIQKFKNDWKSKFSKLIDQLSVDDLITKSQTILNNEQLNVTEGKFSNKFYEPNETEEYVLNNSNWEWKLDKMTIKVSLNNKTFNLPLIIKDDIEKLFKGISTNLKEFGENLSQAQKRKLFKRLIEINLIKKAD